MLYVYIIHVHTHTHTHTQVLSRSGSVDQQHHFIDLLGLKVKGSISSGVEGVIRGNEKNCTKLRGLPWSATPEDVVSFFGELGNEIAPQGVHMVLNAMVRTSMKCGTEACRVQTYCSYG